MRTDLSTTQCFEKRLVELDMAPLSLWLELPVLSLEVFKT